MAHLLSISEIKAQHAKDWIALSDQQALFITEWISGSIGNGRYSAVEACRVAYPNVKNAAVWSSRLMKNKRVARIVQLHLGLSETRATLFEVNALVKKSKRTGCAPRSACAGLDSDCEALRLEALAARENAKSKVCAETSQEHDTNL